METRNSVFSTLTYTRDTPIRDTWLKLNESCNRYVQRVRRTYDYCEYLKTYEIHKDQYPHIHILFLFRNCNYPYRNDRWLPDGLFAKLKSAWTLGLSDHQSPVTHSNHSALIYILKYISKTSSASHLWSKILPHDTSYVAPLSDLGYPLKNIKYASYKIILTPDSQTLTVCHYKKHKIKLISWSRNFVSAYLSTLKSNEPCLNAP